jgi:hypothetical protein
MNIADMTRPWKCMLPRYLRRPKNGQKSKTTKKPPATKRRDTEAAITQNISFFDLPREIRDQIYHHYWTANPKHVALRTPSHPFTVRLNYAKRPEITREFYVETQRPLTWLLANKQLQHEALEHYITRAEWSIAIGKEALKADYRPIRLRSSHRPRI